MDAEFSPLDNRKNESKISTNKQKQDSNYEATIHHVRTDPKEIPNNDKYDDPTTTTSNTTASLNETKNWRPWTCEKMNLK